MASSHYIEYTIIIQRKIILYRCCKSIGVVITMCISDWSYVYVRVHMCEHVLARVFLDYKHDCVSTWSSRPRSVTGIYFAPSIIICPKAYVDIARKRGSLLSFASRPTWTSPENDAVLPTRLLTPIMKRLIHSIISMKRALLTCGVMCYRCR